MILKGIDRTYGASTLQSIAMELHEKRNEQDKYIDYLLIEKFKKLYPNDWVLSLLCQYSSYNSFHTGDLLWYRNIARMIHDGNLYMTIMGLDSWAFPDKEFGKNKKNVEGADIGIYTKRGTHGIHSADAFFELSRGATFKRIYPGAESTPIDPDEIFIESVHGVVEFGYQKICKSAMTLTMGDMLLRVPYSPDSEALNNIGPCCAIFVNVTPAFYFPQTFD